jgi:CO/xanthine dehydrogenase FAD-binding subunit
MDYVRPSSIDEATAVLEATQGMILAGGTDACVAIAEGVYSPATLIDISGIESMRGIANSETDRGEAMIRIRACTTMSEIAACEGLPNGLRQGARAVGSPQIRNLGTIGGNICNASPCGDTLAPLLTLDARFVLRSVAGARIVACEDFFTGPKQTVRRNDEILECIDIPARFLGTASAFRMIGNRKGQAISQVNAAASVTWVEGTMTDVRVAVGSVAPVPLRLAEVEEFLTGKRFKDVGTADLRGPVVDGIRPIDDVRSSANYRQEVTVSLILQALADCASQDSSNGEGAGR